MDRIIQQTKLSLFSEKKEPIPPKKPGKYIDWKKTPPQLKKFLLLHIIRAFEENSGPNKKINKKGLINLLSKNMGNIAKEQVKIFIDNLIYQRYIQELTDHELRYTDKIYEDLKKIDKIIKKQMYYKKYQRKNTHDNQRGFTK